MVPYIALEGFEGCGEEFGPPRLVLLAFVQPDIDNRRSAKPFAPQVMAVIQQTGLPLSTTNLPEEASFYLPLDVPIATDHSPRMLVIVDDGRLAIDRGKLVLDARFFSPLLDGANVIDATRVPTPQSPPRWKLYEVSIDREHA